MSPATYLSEALPGTAGPPECLQNSVFGSTLRYNLSFGSLTNQVDADLASLRDSVPTAAVGPLLFCSSCSKTGKRERKPSAEPKEDPDLRGVQTILQDRYDHQVTSASYEVTDATIDSQLVSLHSAGIDVLMTVAGPKFRRAIDPQGRGDELEAATRAVRCLGLGWRRDDPGRARERQSHSDSLEADSSVATPIKRRRTPVQQIL
jgi:hypothetical protein